MPPLPHSDLTSLRLNCSVITVSDTRTSATDKSGQIIQQLLSDAAHSIQHYTILKDEPIEITQTVVNLSQRSDIDVIILNGGTGIAPRDTTYESIVKLLEKTLPGFGELFRVLSYQEIGSRAIASRAIAGIFKDKLIFSLPGSSKGVHLAMTALILPELSHLMSQLHSSTSST
ncbi:MAG: MogA/MoaB family molybdenum cofactor biosynthesis protein [Microcoleaceae cyanobacterium]